MQLPALAATRGGFDLGRTLTTVAALKSSKAKNRLLDAQAAKLETTNKLASEIFAVDETVADGQPVDSAGTAGPVKLNHSALRRMARHNPKLATQFLEFGEKANAAERAKARRAAQQAGKLALGVISAPPEQRAMVYQQSLAVARQMGLDISNAPAQDGPEADRWLRAQLLQAHTLDSYLEHMEKQKHKKSNTVRVMTPTGPKLVPVKEAVEKGLPLEPKSKNLQIDFNDDGTVRTISQGGSGGSNDLAKRTQGTVEDKILKAGDTMSQLTSITQKFKPEYQQIGTKWSMLKTKLKDKAGFELDTDEKSKLDEFSAYRADAGQLFALTLKDLSGVAVNPTEFKRAEGWLPNPGTGLFDGDSPTELESKMNRFKEFTRKALIKYNYIRKNGMSIDDVDVDDMPKIVQKRGDELQKELSAQGITGNDLLEAVRQRLADEFGLVAG